MASTSVENSRTQSILGQTILPEQSKHRIALFDAFTDKTLGGSVAAMVDDASELETDQMQRIAKEFGAPATCFITVASADAVTVRFFSTMTEYPMCGHGTIGLMTWLADRDIIPCTENQTSTISLSTPAGSADVEVRRRVNGRVEVMLTLAEAPFEKSPVDALTLASCLGIDVGGFADALPIELSRSDFIHLMVPIRDLATMQAMAPDFGAITSLCHAHGIGTISLISVETVHPESTIHCREFAPALGTPEAPASGTTNRANACFLLRHGLINATVDGMHVIIAEQGYEMGRPSEVRSELTLKNGILTKVRVGGIATKSIEGHLYL